MCRARISVREYHQEHHAGKFPDRAGNGQAAVAAETYGRRILILNCWNEWTEGSYLEPDTVHGMAYLDAVKEVFGDTAK
jgi:hypothetical protein